MTRELKLIFYTCTLYVSFIYWGYLQEKITSSSYACESGTDNDALRWNFPRALNLVMAAAASLSAAFVGDVLLPLINPGVGADKSNAADSVVSAPFMLFAKPAITCAIGSPLGYMALKYIPFPLVILTKSSKPIPVMLIGIIFYRKSYPWYKHVGTFLLCSGIVAFSYWKQSGAHGAASGKGDDGDDFYSLCVGILLVGMNLALDGYTNNEQEHIFKKYQVSSCQMMKNVNVWQVIFLGLYLTFMHFVSHESGPSELQQAYNLLLNCSEARHDVAIFCLCAAVGQLTIFVVMKEFGSLMWITISITRKLFTILVSVIMFNHVICFEQWMGVAAVFAGLTLEVVMSYSNKGKNEQVKDTKKND